MTAISLLLSRSSEKDSEASDVPIDNERTASPLQPLAIPEDKSPRPPNLSASNASASGGNRDSAVKQMDELYSNERLPDTIICLYTGLTQTQVRRFKWRKKKNVRFPCSQVTLTKLKEYNLSAISLSTLTDAKAVLNNLIQRIQKKWARRVSLLGIPTLFRF